MEPSFHFPVDLQFGIAEDFDLISELPPLRFYSPTSRLDGVDGVSLSAMGWDEKRNWTAFFELGPFPCTNSHPIFNPNGQKMVPPDETLLATGKYLCSDYKHWIFARNIVAPSQLPPLFRTTLLPTTTFISRSKSCSIVSRWRNKSSTIDFSTSPFQCAGWPCGKLTN